jgi:prefoldin beta subunit
MDSEIEKKVQRLSLLEQNMQNLALQKQNFQLQVGELESAEEQLGKSDEAYKIVANILVKSPVDDLKEEVSKRIEVAQLRISSLEKQEKKLREKAKALQKEVLGGLESQDEQ